MRSLPRMHNDAWVLEQLPTALQPLYLLRYTAQGVLVLYVGTKSASVLHKYIC